MGSVDPGLQPRARSAPEERNGSSAVEKEIGEAARAASHDHRPKPLRVARIASLEGGMTMSRKPSTAALDSFRQGSFLTRRRAPRHPAGASITTAFDHLAGRTLLFRRPGLQPRRKDSKTEWALALKTLFPSFRRREQKKKEDRLNSKLQSLR